MFTNICYVQIEELDGIFLHQISPSWMRDYLNWKIRIIFGGILAFEVKFPFKSAAP